VKSNKCDTIALFCLLTLPKKSGGKVWAAPPECKRLQMFSRKSFSCILFFICYTIIERLGNVMAFIVGCFVGLLVGVLGSVVVKALKESQF
jgi:hypothetical protein